MTATHPLNWYAGWTLIVTAFVTGAILGLFFHRDDFLGGYDSFRRRLLRLGHIALAALGGLNVLFSVAAASTPSLTLRAASLLLLVGASAMPTICFLTAWKMPFRHLFFIPVSSLLTGTVLVIAGGAP